MRKIGIIGTFLSMAIMLLLFGARTPVYAFQDEHQQDAKPPHDQETKPPDEAKPPKDAHPTKDAKPQQEAKPDEKSAQRPEQRPEGKQVSRSSIKQGRLVSGRIPDDQFRGHFGRAHTFAIRQPIIIDNQPGFQYGGYWFSFGAGWPVGWAYTDDVYVDFINGEYVLIDPLHPGFQLALVIIT
jgi:hypothetical protein